MVGTIVFAMLCFLLLYGKAATAVCGAAAALAGLIWFAVTRKPMHEHSSGFVSIDTHARRSRLLSVSAGVKLTAAVASVVICVAFSSAVLPLLLLLCTSAITVGLGGTPPRYYLRLLRIPALFIMVSAIAVIVQLSGEPFGIISLKVGGMYLCVSKASQSQAALIILKALGSVSCLYALSLSTPLESVIAALRRAKVPAVLVELMYLIYRYIFVLLEAQTHMQNAAASRLGYHGAKTSLNTALHGSMNLVFLSFRRSSDCFAAMESRCYDGEIRFLETAKPVRAAEVVAAAGFCALLVLIGIIT